MAPARRFSQNPYRDILITYPGEIVMHDNTIRFFSGAAIHAVLSMEKCIEAMKVAFTALSHGQAVMPVRMRLEMEADNANALFMPVYIPAIKKVGIKAVTNNIDNAQRGLPIVHALMMLFDSETGKPLAVMDGEAITAMRTGAVSGLATSLLARSDARTAAIIGTGTQGETQLEAVCTVREITTAYVFDRDAEKSRAFAEKMGPRLGIQILTAESPDAIEDADVICTATPSRTPVFDHSLLKKGVHINGVGSYKPDMIEIPYETIAAAKVVVDHVQGCLVEAGDLVQPMQQGIITQDHIHGELGDVVTGKISARENDEETTVFKSVGVAVQDLACADLVLRMAQRQKLGTPLKL